MDIKKVLKITEKFVKSHLDNEGTGHDWWHIQRVRNNAKLICNGEKADKFIIDLAILLHDVGDRKVIKKNEDDYSIAENFLKKQRISHETIKRVMFIVKNMSFSKSLNAKNNLQSIEFCIVQDADRLDAIGAIGIARAFTYGGNKSRPIYNPNKKSQSINTSKDYKRSKSSSFHHFEEKLLKLKDLMNTKSARRIAIKRHKFMQKYINEFLSEWNGKK